MRGEEIRKGIDVYPTSTEAEKAQRERDGSGDSNSNSDSGAGSPQSLGKSRKAATLAVGETAVSRVLNATPIMVLPPLILVRLQKMDWLKTRPRLVLPVSLGAFFSSFFQVTKRTLRRGMNADTYVAGLIFTTSIFALPLALAAFPQRQAVHAHTLEEEFWDRGGKEGLVEFNRGI